jgi:hypothetical protein
MKWISATVSFLLVFAAVFFLGGWFLMPRLPSVPTVLVSVFEQAYWMDSWIGVLLGIILGMLSAMSVLKKAALKK